MVQNGAMKGLCLSLLLLGACASTAPIPPSPAPPETAWTYEISYDDQGYCETIQGPTYASRADARTALEARLRDRDYRGPRAAVLQAD